MTYPIDRVSHAAVNRIHIRNHVTLIQIGIQFPRQLHLSILDIVRQLCLRFGHGALNISDGEFLLAVKVVFNHEVGLLGLDRVALCILRRVEGLERGEPVLTALERSRGGDLSGDETAARGEDGTVGVDVDVCDGVFDLEPVEGLGEVEMGDAGILIGVLD